MTLLQVRPYPRLMVPERSGHRLLFLATPGHYGIRLFDLWLYVKDLRRHRLYFSERNECRSFAIRTFRHWQVRVSIDRKREDQP